MIYDGPEGVIEGPGAEDDIAFVLDLGNGALNAHLYPDGSIVYSRPHTVTLGEIVLRQSQPVEMTPEEAAPYKAFLRTKGVQVA